MYRHPSHELYAQNLGTDLAARGGGGGGGRKKQRRRSQSRSRSQSQGRRSHSRGSTQYSRRKGASQHGHKRKRGRRGMREEMGGGGGYPAHLEQQFGYPPPHMAQQFGYPPPHMAQQFGYLSQPVSFKDGGHKWFVKKTGGVRRAVKYDPKMKPSAKGKVWNGFVVGHDNKVYVVKGNTIREPHGDKEQAAALRYLEKSSKKNHKNGKHHEGKKHDGKKHNGKKHKHPHIAQSKYTALYNDVHEIVQNLRTHSKTPGAEYKAPGNLEKCLDEAKAMIEDYMASRDYFAGRYEKRQLGLPLQYLAHGKQLQGLTFGGQGPPEYLAHFHQVVHGTGEMSGQDKYKAVLHFMSKLQSSIRKAVNAQSSQKRREEGRKKLMRELVSTFGVSESDLRTVINACVIKVTHMNAGELKGLKMSHGENSAIALGLVLHFASTMDRKDVTWTKFTALLAAHHEAHHAFVTAREKTFKKAVKKAHRILYNRMKAAERAAGGGHAHKAGEGKEHVHLPPTVHAGSSVKPNGGPEVKPGGLASRLVSMRYD